MRHNPLPSQDRLLELFTYDETSGWLVWRSSGKRAGSVLPTWYKRVTVDGVSYYQHRILFKMANGFDPVEIDHRDPADTGANDPANLRDATSSQNKCNRRGFAKSGFKGVLKRKNRFVSFFTFQGVQTYLGSYKTPEEAHEQYAIMAELFHGEFANTEHKNAQ